MGTVRHIGLVVALALVVASCGSSDGSYETSSTTSTTVAATTTSTTRATTTSSTTTTPTTTSGPSLPATAYIATAQVQLKALGYFDGDVDGIPGPITVDAVTAFQKDAGIGVDGEVGPETEAALAEAVQNDPTFVEEVIQEGLMELGLYPGPADGDYGKGTRRGVERLQGDCELEPDGFFTIFTHICLEAALRA